MNTPTLLRMTAPLRDDFDIPYHDVGPVERTPRLALVAGLHGNELNGVFVLARLAAFLRDVEQGKRPDLRLRERVLLVPAVNVLGVNLLSRVWPFDKIDLNRVFPGLEGGETTQRIAAALLRLTRGAYYRIDIHSSNLDIEELPQVRLYAPNDDERATACLFGLPAVIERPLNKMFMATLVHAWRAHGGENFVLQAGRAGDLQSRHCETLFRSLVAFLDRTGIVEGLTLADDEEDLHYFGLRQSYAVLSEQAGFFVGRIDPGRWVQTGELLGHLYDGFTGDLLKDVHTPVAGLVCSVRRQPLLFEGDLLCRIQTLDDSGNDVEVMLHGQGQ